MSFQFPDIKPARQQDENDLIIDLFAGGGGVSTGIEIALDRSPDYALNHDGPALAMHLANHPDTIHIQKNIHKVDPADIVGRRRVGLLWASPDCKHFSKAKGGKPIKRAIRDLAWTVVLWAKRTRPKVIFVENVEEFADWGPLILRNSVWHQDPDRRGHTFRRWLRELRRLGYKAEWKIVRMCDHGDPTIRRRLLIILRCDGQPIVWPEPSHGDPKSPAVISGKRRPYRTAAEIIDWSLPVPSIFERAEEIKAKFGLTVKRPLVDNTLRRIATGVYRYVIEAEEPYFVSYAQQGGKNRSATEPLHTVTASSKDQNTIVVPTLVQTGYGERPGQSPRVPGLENPLGTVVAGGVKHAVVSSRLMQASYIQRDFGKGIGHGVDEPVATITSGGGGHAALVSAFLAQHNTGVVGHSAEKPFSTITGRGTQQALVAAHMLSMKGTDRRDGPVTDPLPAVCAGGTHAALVAAFMVKYYGSAIGASLSEPIHSVTTKQRFGLVTVEIAGETWVIADIGMRTLTPPELFLAQGFPPGYKIDPVYNGKPLSKTKQIACCGNAVPPNTVARHILANCAWLKQERAAA